MEKTKLIKIFLVIAVSLALVLGTTSVFAADATNNTTAFIDVTEANTNTNGSSTNNTNTNTNTNTNINTNTNTNTNTNVNTNSNTNLIANVNSSSYNNTNLPSTGLAETGSVICIVFALAVSAIYAFKKMRDYNI